VRRVLARHGECQSAFRAPDHASDGGAAERLKAILPPGMDGFIHLTITDEPPLAQAFIVIEARPARRSFDSRGLQNTPKLQIDEDP
jgi:hypothetical protein